MGPLAQHCEGERQTQAQRQKEADEPRAQAFKQINMLLSSSKLSSRAGSGLFYTFHAPVMASSDVSVAAAVAGQYNLSEGVGAGVGLNLCDTAKQLKSQEGQSGEYLCLIVRQNLC